MTAKETEPSGNESPSGTANATTTTTPPAPDTKETKSRSQHTTAEG
ncbi:hypothetical protein [Staphylococcus aureus]|nr:hypothetical protein [Staphylococcus aureus]